MGQESTLGIISTSDARATGVGAVMRIGARPGENAAAVPTERMMALQVIEEEVSKKMRA